MTGDTPDPAKPSATALRRRGRFAPSPSGPLHFGSLIAALGSFLDARSRGGEWLVRIEDIDPPRVVPGATDDILRTLERYGLSWDGPVMYQSRRTERYRESLEHLIKTGSAYPCTCSRREVARHGLAGAGGPIYPGTCRNGNRRRAGRSEAIRLQVGGTAVAFDDRIQGSHSQDLATEVGDFVIRRADGLFAYQLAVVVDDADQGISDIVRGSDLLESTPRQVFLQRSLGLPTPRYAHLPVAVDSHGSKLSKQTQAPPLDRDRPGPALVAALRFLNQNPAKELTYASPDAILEWALANWRPEKIPPVRSIACPDAGVSADGRALSALKLASRSASPLLR